MGIIGAIIIGFFVGLIARFVKPGNDHMGVFSTTLLGILGAVIGRFIGEALGIYSSNHPAGFVGAVLGAVLLLAFSKASREKNSMLR